MRDNSTNLNTILEPNGWVNPVLASVCLDGYLLVQYGAAFSTNRRECALYEVLHTLAIPCRVGPFGIYRLHLAAFYGNEG
jgi:hypothetical protein